MSKLRAKWQIKEEEMLRKNGKVVKLEKWKSQNLELGSQDFTQNPYITVSIR